MSAGRRGSTGFQVGRKAEDPRQIPLDVGATYFGGGLDKIPVSVVKVVPLLHDENKCSRDVVRGCLQGVIRYMKDGSTFSRTTTTQQSEAGAYSYGKFQSGLISMSKDAMDTDDMNLLFTGLLSMVGGAVRSKTPTNLVVDHLKSMNVPAFVAEDIGQTMMKSRVPLEKVAFHNKEGFPRLSSFRWRVDVTISSGSLSRVMVPTLLFQMTLSSGKIYTFGVKIQEFNQLRYGVAKMLRDMSALERHPVMRVENEEEKKRQLEAAKAPK